MHLRLLFQLAPLTLCLFASGAPCAQPVATPATPDLAQFEGHYAYRDGGTLAMVGDRGRLFAIIGESKYALRIAGTDLFMNAGGDTIPFLRGADGKVVAFSERGDVHARLASTVPAAARALFEARPPGQGAYRYQRPVQLGDGIAVAAAGPAATVAARLVNGVIDGSYPDVHSILVHRNGALLLEEYFYGYDRDRQHQMRSLTKSVIALLAGAAVDRGLLRADAPVLGRLGAAPFANPDPRKTRITLADLLSHQSGMACNDHDGSSPGNEVKLYETADWVQAFADLPMLVEPGTVGRYCSGGILAAGRAVERAAGKPLPTFAQEVLFGPLGIRSADWRWDFTLDRSRRGEFGQIHLRPRDMLKLGILILQRGQWEGRRVLSSDWIAAATAHRAQVDDSDYGLGLWHRWYHVKTAGGVRRVDTVMLSGNGGQKVYIVPALELIVVLTGGAFNVNSPVNEMMARVLLPALLDGGQ